MIYKSIMCCSVYRVYALEGKCEETLQTFAVLSRREVTSRIFWFLYRYVTVTSISLYFQFRAQKFDYCPAKEMGSKMWLLQLSLVVVVGVVNGWSTLDRTDKSYTKNKIENSVDYNYYKTAG
jgi:hypothetical protein